MVGVKGFYGLLLNPCDMYILISHFECCGFVFLFFFFVCVADQKVFLL